MEFGISIWFSIILVVVSASQLQGKDQNSLEPIRPQIWFIVTVEGKSFFAETTPRRTWNEANSYCASMGMTLASINTNQQYMALQNSYNPDTFNGEYWTSAMTVDALPQFAWSNGTGEQPGSFLDFKGCHNMAINSLTFKIQSDKIGKLYGNQHSMHYGTLCQTID